MEKTHEIWVGSPALIQEGNESKRLWICWFLMGSSSLKQLKPLVMGRKIGAVWSGIHPSHWPQVLQPCRDYPGHGAAPGLSSPPYGLGHRSPPGRWKASPGASGAQHWEHLGLFSCSSLQSQPHVGAAARDGQAKRDCANELSGDLGFA